MGHVFLRGQFHQKVVGRSPPAKHTPLLFLPPQAGIRPKLVFLDFHDSLGALQPKREAGIFLLEKGHFSRERVGFGDLWAALDRRQGAESACIALPAPVGQRRGVKALTAQNGGDAAGVSRAVRVGENAQLILGGEDPAVWTSGKLG